MSLSCSIFMTNLNTSGGCTLLLVAGTQKSFAFPTMQPCAENSAASAAKSAVAFSFSGSFILWHLR